MMKHKKSVGVYIHFNCFAGGCRTFALGPAAGKNANPLGV